MRIRDMLYMLWQKVGSHKNPIKTEWTSITINKAKSSNQTVTAPTVNGYTFICWIVTTTVGWIGTAYYEDADAPTTTVWISSETQSGTGRVDCHALYVKNTLT